MKAKRLSLILFLLIPTCLVAQSDKTDSKLDDQLKKATAVCLVEITRVSEKDGRAYDGNWEATLELKSLAAKGKPPKSLTVIKGFGGMYPRGKRPKLDKTIPHKLLKRGQKMWLVFHQSKVVRCWAADAKDIPEAVTALAKNSSDDGKKAEVLKSAKGVALVEISDISEKDGRPYDANYTVTVQFKILKSRGKVPSSLTMVKAFGGRRRGVPALPSVLKHDSMKKGEKHWLVFSDTFDADKYPNGVAAWWPADSKSIPDAVKKFVEKK